MSSLKGKKVGYLLIVSCDSSVHLPLKAVDSVLPKGWYLYIGSANIRNPLRRIERHFKQSKALHWHIDYLTKVCEPSAALMLYGVSEDELYTIILSQSITEPVKRFGNTDKPQHVSHLFRICSPADNIDEMLAIVYRMISRLKKTSLELYLP
jgi:Uri superfamily endonuclease